MFFSANGTQIRNYNEMVACFKCGHEYRHTRKLLHEEKDRRKVIAVIASQEDKQADIFREILEKSPEELFSSAPYNCIFPAVSNKSSGRTVNITGEQLTKDAASLNSFLEAFVPTFQKNSRQSQDLFSAILTYVRDVTNKVMPCLSDDQAYEVLLFSTLFAFLQCKPKEEDLRVLREYVGVHTTPSSINPVQEEPDLEESSPKEPIQKDADIKILVSEETLPFFPGCLPQELPPLALRNICNETNSYALVKLKGCTLQRHLAPGEKVLALTAGGQVVTFLPRFCVTQNLVIWQEEDRLESEMSVVPLENDSVHFFAESERFGLLIADARGNFFPKEFRGVSPDFSTRYLRADCQDYGFLKEDGSYSGFIHRETWKNLLMFDLGLGSGIAITSDRCAIDSQGQVLSRDVVEISCLKNRYILLQKDGTVVTDQGVLENLPTVRAVGIDSYGYWASTDKGLYFVKAQSKQLPGPLPNMLPCDEFQRNNTGSSLYALNENLEFQRLR